MSLHVDFLRESERHDPVAGVLRTAVFSAGGLVFAGCILYVLFVYFGLCSANLNLDRAHLRNDTLSENVKMAVSLEKELLLLRQRNTELQALSNASFKASSCLDAIAKSVPEKIQLTSLRIKSDVVSKDEKNERYGRFFKGDISGSMNVSASEHLVVDMIRKMRTIDNGILGDVSPGGYNIDPMDPSISLFDLRLEFGFRDCGSLKPGSSQIQRGTKR